MKTVTERDPAKPVPNARMMATGERPAISPAVIPATVTTSIELSRRAKPTTTTATASRTHMVHLVPRGGLVHFLVPRRQSGYASSEGRPRGLARVVADPCREVGRSLVSFPGHRNEVPPHGIPLTRKRGIHGQRRPERHRGHRPDERAVRRDPHAAGIGADRAAAP